MQRKNKYVHFFIIFTFVILYLLVSIISMIHVIDFFRLSNNNILATVLAIAFEVGAVASLASLIILEKMNKFIVWSLFIILTLFQIMGNTYYAFIHLDTINYKNWIDLFGFNDYTDIEQKRILSLISGGILPLVALGFIKALIDYLKPENEENKKNNNKIEKNNNENLIEEDKKKYKRNKKENNDILKNIKDPELKKIIKEYINKNSNNNNNNNPYLVPGIHH